MKRSAYESIAIPTRNYKTLALGPVSHSYHQSDRGPACHAWTRDSVLGLEYKGATCIALFKGCNTNVSLGASL